APARQAAVAPRQPTPPPPGSPQARAPAARAPAAPRRPPSAPQARQPQPSVSDWDDDARSPLDGAAGKAGDWDDDEAASHMSGLTGLSNLSGVSRTSGPAGPLPSVSASDPYAPAAMARLCMLSPGVVMQVARQAPVGASPVLQLIGSLREAKDERGQSELMRRFINEHRENATRTLEMLLTT
ncbi:MAG: hypothetical protein ABIJ09_08790, partial [Pseudomonadota bacterium]